eukprot:Gb_20669 [translate_table: standard]
MPDGLDNSTCLFDTDEPTFAISVCQSSTASINELGTFKIQSILDCPIKLKPCCSFQPCRI